MADKPQSLEAWAKEHEVRRLVCTVCAHPAREELERGAKAGVRYTVMSAWMKAAHNTSMDAQTISRHCRGLCGYTAPYS